MVNVGGAPITNWTGQCPEEHWRMCRRRMPYAIFGWTNDWRTRAEDDDGGVVVAADGGANGAGSQND